MSRVEPAPFEAIIRAMDSPDVLEMGTKRWGPDPTEHSAWAPHAASWLKLDAEDGIDVDVVGNAHALPFGKPRFDVVLACSVFEHLERPWIAAAEVMRVLRPGGVAMVETHQTFPIHGYPSDFFRFTAEALSLIFTDAGGVTQAGYNFPCQIVPPADVAVWNVAAEAFLNVWMVARKPR